MLNKIIEEKSPTKMIILSSKKLPIAVNSDVENISFDKLPQNSSEIDEREVRIIKFLEEEDIDMANPKQKAWEYSEKIRQKAFQLHTKFKREKPNKNFSLDNAHLFNKRRSSCLELGYKFLSPPSMKTCDQRRDFDESLMYPDSSHNTSESTKSDHKNSLFKRDSTKLFGIKPFVVDFEEEQIYSKTSKNKTSSIIEGNFSTEMKIFKV